MPAATSGRNLPYPLGTDRLMDGDDQIRKLAQSVDNMIQSGQVTIPITAVATPVSANVTFPIPFASPPAVLVGIVSGNPGTFTVAVAPSPTATGCVIWGRRETGTSSYPAVWLAIGPVVTVS